MNKAMALCGLLILGAASHAEAGGSVWDQSKETHAGARDITVYRSPTCGCCSAWIEHLQKHGFNVADIETDDLLTIKRKHAVPSRMRSCHTAVIDGYVIEGHVPADDVKRLLRDKPPVAGLVSMTTFFDGYLGSGGQVW